MVTYKQAGVDIQAGYEVVKRARRLAKSTYIKGVFSEIGLFGGCFALDNNKVLVSATDGVGTKLKLAFLMGKHDTVGIDLVAMNADDVVTCGARPLFFLDYIGCHKVDPKLLEKVLVGVAKGCKLAGCALIGGETAELTDIYKPKEYDLAGFCVGIVDKKDIIDPSKIKVGDKIIGLASSGLHSNGYTLARKVLFQGSKLSVNDKLRGLNVSIGEELLKPTRIYSKSILSLLKKVKPKGIAHITGGGLPENIGRILPKGCRAFIDRFTWTPQPIFQLIQMHGRVSKDEMFKTFNMGIGMALVVKKADVSKTLKALKTLKEKAYIIGEIRKGKRGVEIN